MKTCEEYVLNELKGIHGCSFNLYNDDNKEMFEALEEYAKYEEQ